MNTFIREALAESLREREILIREIHHRVKNNIQVLQGMLSSAAREAESAEARAVLSDAARRLAAVGSVQQILYSSKDLATARADDFLERLAAQIRADSDQVAA